MSKARFTFLFALAAVASSAASQTLPKLVSDDVRQIVQKAEQAVAESDYQLALALYKGALYADGITFAIELRTVDHFDQQDAVLFALRTWAEELDGDFPVKLVEDTKDADVVLEFVDSIEAQGPDALGLIRLRKNYRWNSSVHDISYNGTIQIVRSAAPDGALSEAEILDVVMHEFGHLLGLGDVSKVGVLMGPMRRGKPMYRPTVNETEDVRKLRAMLRSRIDEVQRLAKQAGTSKGGLSLAHSHAVR